MEVGLTTAQLLITKVLESQVECVGKIEARIDEEVKND